MSARAERWGRTLGTELEDILAPISVDTFLREYWGQKPLYIPGDPKKFHGLFDRDHFREALLASERPLIHASYDRGRTEFEITPAEVESVYNKGATVCAAYLEEGSKRLMSLCESIRRQLGLVGIVDARAYWSPHGTGFDQHYDARVATTLQIEGRKRWRFSSRPTVSWPAANKLDFDVRDESMSSLTFEEVTLSPGDVLSLPPGTWHSATAEGYSLAINLAINPISFYYLAMEQVHTHLQQKTFWREPVPPLGRDVSASGRPPPPDVQRYLAARFAELGNIFTNMSGDVAALREFWYFSLLAARRRSAHTAAKQNAGTLNGPAREPAHLSGALDPSDTVTLKDNVDAYQVTSDDDKPAVVVYYGPPARKLSLPIACRDLVEKLLSRKSFEAHAARTWLGDASWTQVEELLRRLASSGLIQVCPCQPKTVNDG